MEVKNSPSTSLLPSSAPQSCPETIKLGQKIGKGTYGKVYESFFDQEPITIKLNLVKNRDNDGIISIREIDNMMATNHLNIVPLLKLVDLPRIIDLPPLLPNKETGRIRRYDDIALGMKNWGVNLATLVDDNEYELPMDEIQNLMYKILLGLEHLHSKGIIHRDLKPHNILVDSESHSVKICDMGLGKRECIQEEGTPRALTPAYRPLEVWCGGRYSFKADIWSVGCIFFEMMQSKRPTLFVKGDGKTEIDNVMDILKVHPNPPSASEIRSLGSLRIRTQVRPTGNTWMKLCPHSTKKARALLSKMLECMPARRWSARQCLDSDFFDEVRTSIDNIRNRFPEEVFLYKITDNDTTRKLMIELVKFYNTTGYIRVIGQKNTPITEWARRRRLPFIVFGIILDYGNQVSILPEGTDLEQLFYVILFIGIKYLTTLEWNPARATIIPERLRTEEKLKEAVQIEKSILLKLSFQVYTQNPYDSAKRKLEPFEINRLFAFMVNNYKSFNKKTVDEVYQMYIQSKTTLATGRGVILEWLTPTSDQPSLNLRKLTNK